ncbi:MAG: DUF885 family protein [Clostridiales bacterium]|nr:DUF885 family protein [Clostridiales bacterium]
MKKHTKLIAVAMSGVMSLSVLVGLAGCGNDRYSSKTMEEEFGPGLALSIMGNDAFAWNAFSATPYESFGYAGKSTPSWYSYNGRMSKSDISSANYAFDMYYDELKHYNLSDLNRSAAITYRSIAYILDTYRSYYKSKYVGEFDLLGGSYITSEGGYVADFALSFENFEFRNEKDVNALLAVTKTTDEAFATYLEYAGDCDEAGYPLYDYTVKAMRDYLIDVYEKGDDYYLFDVAEKKIDGAQFLTSEQKNTYKNSYRAALLNDYMEGVKSLYDGLADYTGNVETVTKSYLARAGAAGKAYYEWLFRQKTGLKSANIANIYGELYNAYTDYMSKRDSILEEMDALQSTDPATFNDFQAYLDGDKVLLGLTDPAAILAYLKTAAKDIVPDLKTDPDIGFKYMDDTVSEITNALAYYMRTPIDQKNSREMITLNAYQMEKNPSELLTTIAHEGYPGHLYAHVNAKERGTSLMSTCASCISFSEGWSNYAELVLLDNIAKTADKATAKFCEYTKYQTLAGYINMVLFDMNVNYFGMTATELGGSYMIERLMEIPAAYVPYGYGMYVMYTLHEKAKNALGAKYSEPEFNGLLLAEGFGPTLTRAKEITDGYIKKKK